MVHTEFFDCRVRILRHIGEARLRFLRLRAALCRQTLLFQLLLAVRFQLIGHDCTLLLDSFRRDARDHNRDRDNDNNNQNRRRHDQDPERSGTALRLFGLLVDNRKFRAVRDALRKLTGLVRNGTVFVIGIDRDGIAVDDGGVAQLCNCGFTAELICAVHRQLQYEKRLVRCIVPFHRIFHRLHGGIRSLLLLVPAHFVEEFLKFGVAEQGQVIDLPRAAAFLFGDYDVRTAVFTHDIQINIILAELVAF